MYWPPFTFGFIVTGVVEAQYGESTPVNLLSRSGSTWTVTVSLPLQPVDAVASCTTSYEPTAVYLCTADCVMLESVLLNFHLKATSELSGLLNAKRFLLRHWKVSLIEMDPTGLGSTVT